MRLPNIGMVATACYVTYGFKHLTLAVRVRFDINFHITVLQITTTFIKKKIISPVHCVDTRNSQVYFIKKRITYLLTFLVGIILNFISAFLILALCPVDMLCFASFLPSLPITG